MEDNLSKEAFHHRYKVFNSENVLLTHIIQTRLSLSDMVNTEGDQANCEICSKVPDLATIYCQNCEKYMCDECDDTVHEMEEDDQQANPVLQKIIAAMTNHKRDPINNIRVRYGKCIDHPERDNEYFDLLRNKALCL